VACAQGFAEEPFSCLGISGLTEHELQGIACGIHGSVQIHPLPLYLKYMDVADRPPLGRKRSGLSVVVTSLAPRTRTVAWTKSPYLQGRVMTEQSQSVEV